MARRRKTPSATPNKLAACEGLFAFDEERKQVYDAARGRLERALQAYAESCNAAAKLLEVELESALARLRPTPYEAPSRIAAAIWDGLNDEGQAAINERRRAAGRGLKVTRKSMRAMLATAEIELKNIKAGK